MGSCTGWGNGEREPGGSSSGVQGAAQTVHKQETGENTKIQHTEKSGTKKLFCGSLMLNTSLMRCWCMAAVRLSMESKSSFAGGEREARQECIPRHPRSEESREVGVQTYLFFGGFEGVSTSSRPASHFVRNVASDRFRVVRSGGLDMDIPGAESYSRLHRKLLSTVIRKRTIEEGLASSFVETRPDQSARSSRNATKCKLYHFQSHLTPATAVGNYLLYAILPTEDPPLPCVRDPSSRPSSS